MTSNDQNDAISRVWTSQEVDLIVADYMAMLTAQLRGEEYSKAAHRRALIALLQNRSEGSIERKHQNISAVLIELGFPYITGYKPLSNYQSLLYDRVAERVGGDRMLSLSVRSCLRELGKVS